MEPTTQDLLSTLPKLSEKELEELEQVLVQKAKQKVNQEELDDYYTWVQAVWVNSRKEGLDFTDHRYLVDIYRDQHPHIVYQKPAQMGISERLISEAVWVCDRLKKVVLYVFPTSAQLSDFVQARLDPVFNFSDYLSRITGVLSSEQKKDAGVDQARKVQKVGLKQIGQGFLYLRGSQNEQQIISVDADMVVLDERDRFIQEHVPYIDKRLMHSTLRWRREASTPTFPGRGVNQNFMKSDQRIWMLMCEKCGLEQELDFRFNVDFDKKEIVCKSCKEKLDRLKEGRWVAQKPENSEIHGYQLNGLYNSRRSIAELIEAYEKAQNSGFSEMQQFYNQVLGQPYEAEGKTILFSELDNCTANYMAPCPTKGCVAGVDVGERLHVVISKRIESKIKYVWIGTVTNFMGPEDSLEALMTLYGIQLMVIDAKPETRKVQELIAKFHGKVYASYYPTRKFDVQNYFLFDDFKSEVYIDRTISLDYLVNDVQNQAIELPSNAKAIPNFYEQMTSSIRVTETNPRTGQPSARWMEKSADHYFHAANYNRIAFQKGSVDQALLESYREEKELTPGSIGGWANLVRTKGVILHG